MIIYDRLGIKYESEKYEYNYNLIIDYEKMSYNECHAILNYLYKENSLCEPDIVLLADVIINKLLIIQHDIINPEYKVLVTLIHKLFKMLTKIGNQTQKMVIYHDFNRFIKPISNPLKPISNPASPVSPPVPKKMKKPIKN